jgi:hypothetical protein
MHFTAVESIMDKSIAALLLQMAEQTKSSMAALTSTIANLKVTNDKRLEKYKRDLSNQVKADMILSAADLEICIETIDAKVTEVESDMVQGHDLDIDDLKAFKDDIIPKINIALTCPA